ncbi:MAG: hypothetical protein AAGM67_20860, partial [Bacteroidota bacterium]
MKSIIAILSLFLPLWLMAGQANTSPYAYRMWLFDQEGKCIAHGMYQAHTDSTVHIRKMTWHGPQVRVIPLSKVQGIQFRSKKSERKLKNRAAIVGSGGFLSLYSIRLARGDTGGYPYLYWTIGAALSAI